MSIKDLENDILTQLKERRVVVPASNFIEIRLTKFPLEKINLTKILRKQLVKEQIEYNSSAEATIEIYLTIEGKFNEIQLDDIIKCSVRIENAIGGKLILGNHRDIPNKDELNLSLHIRGCEIETIEIIIPVKRITVFDMIYCGLFEISFINPALSIQEIYIRAHIKKISLRFAKIESCSIFNIDIKEPQNLNDLYILRCEISDFYYQTDLPGNLQCYSSTFSKRFSLLHRGSPEAMTINHNIFEELIVQLESKTSGRLTLEDNSIKILHLRGKAEIGTASMKLLELTHTSLSKDFIGKIENLTFHEGIVMNQFINRGEISFDAIDTQNCPLVIENSILGKTLFINCTIPETIKFRNSSIVETQFFNSAMPMIVESVDGLNTTTLSKNQSDAFRQLKIAATKEGNRELANYYRSKELTAHYKGTSFLKRPAEKISLFLNFSNNHGMSWLQCAVLIFIIVGPLMYGWFLHSLNYGFDFSSSSWATAGELWGHYLEFIIPGYLYPSKTKFAFLGKVLSVENFDISALSLYSRCLIYLNDIVIMPYLIIQMITAFRRHVKSD